jgi:ubiquinone/menaquinone biosynthesis C-methylase UbiE
MTLCCPACKVAVSRVDEAYVCGTCHERYESIQSKPVLIRAGNPYISPASVRALTDSAPAERRRLRTNPLATLYRALVRSNTVAEHHAERVVDAVRSRADQPPVVLEIGGGTRGHGSDVLRASTDVQVVTFDVYASPCVDFVADAHEIPFPDGSVDAVWIQAVLEHVVDPARVVAEIERVLVPGGLVYAETPFMQQVHEGAHDYTRFTHSGHRWLFREFDEIVSGAVGGAGTSLLWALRYFVRTLTGSENAARLTAAMCFWLRAFDNVGPRRRQLDAASGFYFLGRKSPRPLQAKDLVEYYDENGAS